MTDSSTPKDGDFVAYLARMAERTPAVKPAVGTGAASIPAAVAPPPEEAKARQSIEDILLAEEAPTQEFLDGFAELESAPPLSDEELERQALEAPGADGNPQTPE